MAEKVGIEYETLRRYRDVSKAWPQSAPRGAYSVCRELAAHKQRYALLEANPNMTVAEAKQEMDRQKEKNSLRSLSRVKRFEHAPAEPSAKLPQGRNVPTKTMTISYTARNNPPIRSEAPEVPEAAESGDPVEMDEMDEGRIDHAHNVAETLAEMRSDGTRQRMRKRGVSFQDLADAEEKDRPAFPRRQSLLN